MNKQISDAVTTYQSAYFHRGGLISFHQAADIVKRAPYYRRIPLEYHDFYEIVYFESGNVTYTIEGKTYAPEPNDILLINSNECHAVTVNSQDSDPSYKRYVLQLAKNALPFDTSILNMIESTFSPQNRLIKASVVKQFHCLRYLKQLKKLCSNQNDPYFFPNFISTILLFMVELNKTFKAFSTENVPTKKNAEIVEKVIRFIEKNIEKDITLDMLSSELFISKYYLSRIFSLYMNVSVKQYILIKKMHYANALMQNGMTANQACTQIGYNYYASFFHSYKKVFGHPPTQTEKNMANKK
jgi:AraC-like DNA-binding protein